MRGVIGSTSKRERIRFDGALGRSGQVGWREFKAILVYGVRSWRERERRTDRKTQKETETRDRDSLKGKGPPRHMHPRTKARALLHLC